MCYVRSRTDGTLDVYVYILCIDKLIKEFEAIFKDFQLMKFIVSFTTNPFQGRNTSENDELL